MSIPGSASPLFFQAAAAAAAVEGPIKSLRFHGTDSTSLTRTPSSAGNRKTFTWAGWVKKGVQGSAQMLFGRHTASNNAGFDALYFNASDVLVHSGWTSTYFNTTQVFRDSSAWYHIVWSTDVTQSTGSDRNKLYINGSLVSDYSVYNDLAQNTDRPINDAALHKIGGRGDGLFLNGYLADVYFIDGSALDATSFGAFDNNGVWQASSFSGTFGTNGFHLLDFANESTIGHDSSGNNNDFTANNFNTGGTPAVITGSASPSGKSGFSASYPGSYALDGSDTSQASANYSAGDTTTVTVTFNPAITAGSTLTAKIYQYQTYHSMKVNSGSFVTASSSVVNLLSGHGVSAGDSISSITYRTVSPNSAFALGNELYYIKNGGTNIVSTPTLNDVLFDVPTNGDQSDTGAGGEVSGNYCTLNPLDKDSSGKVTLSDGNLEATGNSNRYGYVRGTLAAYSGKYYWEAVTNGPEGGGYGVTEATAPDQDALGDRLIAVAHRNLAYFYTSGFQIFIDGSSVYTGSSVGNGDIVGIAVDVDAGKVWFSHNGTWQGSGTQNPATGTGGYSPTNLKTACPYFHDGAGSNVPTGKFNFGQRAFSYTAPSGFKALCTTNLPTPTIADSSDYFEAKLWTGDGTSNRDITGYSFSPDWVWIKRRSTSSNHLLVDTIRGANKGLFSNLTSAEQNVDNFPAFNSDGFQVSGNGDTNQSSQTFVGWAWDAGSSTASNTDGSITSSVRANQSAGFSIVSYTGSGTAPSTVGHGLGAAPSLIFFKRKDSSSNWITYNSSIGATKYLVLNNTGAAVTDSGPFNNTTATSSVFTVNTFSDLNANGGTYIAYCISPVAGYSAVGSYEGNSTSTFVHTGFRSRFILIKNADDGQQWSSWSIYDTARDTFNACDATLYANQNQAEGYRGSGQALPSDLRIDILSNGFVVKSNAIEINLSGDTYIYYAVAENPFQANGGLAR